MASLATTEGLSDPILGALSQGVNDLINKQVGVGSWCYKVHTLILDRFEEFDPNKSQI